MQVSLHHLRPVPLKERLSKRNSDIWNKDISFGHREWVKIQASSGTGKTTLVHILYKLRDDYEGQVRIGEQLLRELSAESLAVMRQQRMAIVFQDLRLFPQLTCRENIELKRVMQKPWYEAAEVDAMARELGVSHIMEQRAGICSYGEQQRIAIIRALMQPFDWLLMDEPFSHLDQENTRRAAALISSECEKRNAGLLITDLDKDDHFKYTKQFAL